MGREIGGGGVALVYEGHFRNEPVALKTLFDPKVDAALQKEYLDELLVMASLKHKNVVRFIGGCVDPPDLFFVMISASRRVEAPSRHRCASSLGEEVVDGFFFEFEAIRTESSDRDAPRRKSRTRKS